MDGPEQAPNYNDDGFYFHETFVVWEIAFNEALSMQQNLGVVHLAGACLYRLREFDLILAKDIGITVYHIRNWAKENLPTTNPDDHRYEGYIDFNYKVEKRADKIFVFKVDEPALETHTRSLEDVHFPGEGLIATEKINPAASELWASTMSASFQFAQEIYGDSGDGDSPSTTLRRFLRSLLGTAEVQTCLNDIGFSVEGLKKRLSEPD
jgi:hypothetical protein